MMEDKAELNQLMTDFFSTVSFEAGSTPNYADLHQLFIERAVIIKNTGPTPEITNVSEFIAPRQKLVESGALREFREVELSERTDIFGNVAQRWSAYAKRGVQNGAAFEAQGQISTQFIQTPNGWRISAMAWDDEREGLIVPKE